MKAVKCESTTSYPGIHGTSNKITKPKKDVENEEIQVYLSKLKELVPFMPKNRRLSKLEVIQYVIDYICDLQYALDNHPNINSSAVQSAAAVMLCSSTQSNSTLPIVTPIQRQPLGVLTSNANVSVLSDNLSSSSESSPVSSSRQNDKVSSTTDNKSLC